MLSRLCMVTCIAVLALAVLGCDPPPPCDATLTRLNNVCNYPTNVFTQVIPANPTLAPNSAAIISRQVSAVGGNQNILVVIDGWSHTVYYTDAAQTRNSYVRLHLDGNPAYGGATQCGPVRWRSCISGGDQSDGHATVVDTVDSCVYEYWMLNKNTLIADPEAGFGCGMPFNDATAVWEAGEGIGSNAGGALVYASSVWPDECSSSFSHGFMFGAPWSVNNPSQIVYPFYHTDGSGTHADDLREGMRVQLNPTYDISGLPTYSRSVAQACKTYGMYDGNSNGGNWGIYGITKLGYSNNPWNGVLPDPNVGSFTSAPVAQFRVLAVPSYTSSGPIQSNSCLALQGIALGTPPTITSLSATSGSTSGGTAVTLTGTNMTGATTVRFGINNATGVTVMSATQVRCTSPAGTAGECPVTVMTPNGCSNGKPFTYSGGGGSAPTLSSLNPNNGAAAGGTAVTLTGTNFVSGATVSFGGTAATGVVVDSATQIRCTSPAGSGTVSVTVTTSNGTSGGVNYTYNAPPSPPTLSAIAPSSGSTAGGTACTLTGTYLTGCSAVSFGGTAATGIVVDSATQVRATSPAKTAGTYSVTATTANGTSNGVNYTYTSGGTVTTLYSPADSFVLSTSTNTNYGTTNIVIQKNASLEYAGYMKFDLNSVAGTTISNAKLRINFWTTGQAVTKIYSCATDSWTETGLTWGNKPAWGTQQASFTSPNNNWVEVDLTSYIAANFSGDKLVTLVIRQDTNLNVNIQAYSDETGASVSKRPMLIVTSN